MGEFVRNGHPSERPYRVAHVIFAETGIMNVGFLLDYVPARASDESFEINDPLCNPHAKIDVADAEIALTRKTIIVLITRLCNRDD